MTPNDTTMHLGAMPPAIQYNILYKLYSMPKRRDGRPARGVEWGRGWGKVDGGGGGWRLVLDCT